jgi:single-strand DNA-binding protein
MGTYGYVTQRRKVKVQKVELIGRLGKDPKAEQMMSGDRRTNFPLAVSTRYKGEKRTEWFNVTCWGKLAETAESYLRKGQQVYVAGPVCLRKYTNKSGAEQSSLDVRCTELEILTKASPSGNTPIVDDNFDVEVPF